MRPISLITVALLLIACDGTAVRFIAVNRIESGASEQRPQRIPKVFTTQAFSLEIPDVFSRWTTISEGMSGPAYPYFTTSGSNVSMVSATIYTRDTHCPSLGVDKDALREDTNGAWGKVALINAYDRDYSAPCQPYPLDCTDREIFEGSCETKSATYAFCSENDGKAVVICVQQATDDSTLAEDIFRSFRWLE